jgi:formylglycine-generating enzyme required for sulfatase activity
MRYSCARSLCEVLMLLLVAAPAWAVAMAWTPIGNPGNACDPQSQGCFGAVGYAYNIGTYEVTNAQYAEFLNAKGASDPSVLYSTGMADFGGITRSGTFGSYTYSVVPGRGDMPVSYVSFFDALRFANWMNNGQGTGSTETGAYTMLGNDPNVSRNAGATIVLPSEDEWYKAAYYDASSASYFAYPAGSNAQTTCSAPTAAANSANCGNDVGNFIPDDTPVGSYIGSASPYGTFDQGGNVWEFNEAIFSGPFRGYRGGASFNDAFYLAASFRGDDLYPDEEGGGIGFRLAYIPEPSTGLLVFAGLLGITGWRRVRA